MKKKVKLVTEDKLNQAVAAILAGVERMFDSLEKKLNKNFKKLDIKFFALDAGQSDIKRQLTDLKIDTPTREEFNNLKSRVDKFRSL